MESNVAMFLGPSPASKHMLAGGKRANAATQDDVSIDGDALSVQIALRNRAVYQNRLPCSPPLDPGAGHLSGGAHGVSGR